MLTLLGVISNFVVDLLVGVVNLIWMSFVHGVADTWVAIAGLFGWHGEIFNHVY
ncbi:MAG: hypothetical protein LBR73_08930 [Oscillospiraceae bacterium]|jgi:hypothetical protein|nr:hypothetical protein [Oscillospiraceae bacterium]